MRFLLSILILIFGLNLTAQDPSYIQVRFINFSLDETVDPLPQIVEDYDVYYFKQAYPDLGMDTDSFRLIYFIIPENLDTLDALKIALDETEYFIEVIIEKEGIVNSMDVLSQKIELNLFPNPVEDFLNVSIRNRGAVKNAQLRLTNSLGQEIKIYHLDKQMESMMIDMSSLSNGSFFLSYVVDGKVLKTEGFIKT